VAFSRLQKALRRGEVDQKCIYFLHKNTTVHPEGLDEELSSSQWSTLSHLFLFFFGV